MGPRGFGPLTPVLSGLCSNQLSYGPNLRAKPFMCNALIHYTLHINQEPSLALIMLENSYDISDPSPAFGGLRINSAMHFMPR